MTMITAVNTQDADPKHLVTRQVLRDDAAPSNKFATQSVDELGVPLAVRKFHDAKYREEPP